MLMGPYNAIGQAIEVVMTSFSEVYSSYRSEDHISYEVWSVVLWKKILESYTANRRVTDVKYFHNYTNTYPIVQRLLVLSLPRPHKHRVQSGQRAKIFFFLYVWTRHRVGNYGCHV